MATAVSRFGFDPDADAATTVTNRQRCDSHLTVTGDVGHGIE